MSLHLDLAALIEEHFGEHLETPVDVKYDALIAHFANGVTLEARIAAPDAYTIAWAWGEAEFRIDTAPLHPELSTRPNHLHTADGKLLADPLTRTDASAWDNLQRVITTILDNPLLEKPAIGA